MKAAVSRANHKRRRGKGLRDGEKSAGRSKSWRGVKVLGRGVRQTLSSRRFDI